MKLMTIPGQAVNSGAPIYEIHEPSCKFTSYCAVRIRLTRFVAFRKLNTDIHDLQQQHPDSWCCQIIKENGIDLRMLDILEL